MAGNIPQLGAHAEPSTAAEEMVRGDADLVRRLKAGEDAAYEELVRSLTGRLLAVARRMTRSEADAEDVVQEAFVSAFKAMGSFDGRAALSTWLHRIVVNAALMKARKDASRREASIETLLPQFEGGLHKEHPRAWASVTPDGDDGIQQRARLREALERLPEEFRTVIVLKEVAGLESKAIAASLEISDALVRQRLHRGRLALMKLLDPVMSEALR